MNPYVKARILIGWWFCYEPMNQPFIVESSISRVYKVRVSKNAAIGGVYGMNISVGRVWGDGSILASVFVRYPGPEVEKKLINGVKSLFETKGIEF